MCVVSSVPSLRQELIVLASISVLTDPQRTIGPGGMAGLAHADVETPESAGALVARLQRGDAAAFTMIYRQNHVAVRAFARRLVGDVEAAEDLVQEVFVALPTAIMRFRGESSLRTFLLSIAVNRAKSLVRAATRRRAVLAKLAREPERASPDPERDTLGLELADRLMCALDLLPLDQRVVVVLAEIEERTSSEIGSIVGASEGTVRTRLFHAKRKLREILGAFAG